MPMSGHRPTFVEIDLDALIYNFHQVQNRVGAGCGVLAMVKADAYGHGACRVALALERAGAAMFGVALVEEGAVLREEGVSRPILVLGGLYRGQEQEAIELGLTPVVFDLDMARRLNRAALEAGVDAPYHFKVDTGMARVGVLPEDVPAALEELAQLQGLRMVGFISHLALADEPDHPLTGEQVAQFRSLLAQVRQAGFDPQHIHLSNSAAIFTRDLPECNLVRPGVVLYGGLPSGYFSGKLDLRPVMHFRSRVAQLKQVQPGCGVSYGHRFVATRPTLLATVPVGYADGYNRLLSCRGEVLVRGQRAPVTGTVCMDWIMVDVTDVPGVEVGDQVTLFGVDGGTFLGADELASKIGTINYEVFCLVGKRVPRVFHGG